MRQAAAWFLIAAALLAPAHLRAEEPLEGCLAFADSLCAAGDYHRAISEYKRALFLETTPSGRSLIQLHMAACHGRAGDYGEAAGLLRPLAEQKTPEAEPALFDLALVYFLAGEYEEAAATFRRFHDRYPHNPKAREALLSAGHSKIAAGHYGEAAALLRPLAARMPCAEKLLEAAGAPAPPACSPLAAGLFSAAVPGAGQLYCGKPRQALSSLLICGLTAWGAWASWANGYSGAGTLASFAAATVYVGGIGSAVSRARQRNEAARQGWLAALAAGCNLRLGPGALTFVY
ncbi:MAG: CDC27 family protein [Pseudomonadota bacterium]